MELFINQVLAGIATGAIYACMALAVVMIYQAIDHLNFAQGEMAMFSTFIAWQLMQWGVPYWWAFLLTLAFSFAGGIAIERMLFKPLAKAPVLTNVAGFIALFAIVNSVAGLTWDFTIKPVSDAVRIVALPRQSADLDPSGRHDRRHGGTADPALSVLSVHADRPCDARGRVVAGIGTAGRHQHLAG